MFGWLGTILTVFGIVLNAKKKFLCWPVWILSNILWIVHGFSNEDWALTVVNALLIASNAYGANSWNYQDAK